MKIILKTKIKATSNNSNIRSLDKYKLNPEPNQQTYNYIHFKVTKLKLFI